MTHVSEKTPLRLQSANLILEDVRDELMIYDPERNKAFCLNQTAAYVWRHADGKTTVAEMAKRMEEELKKPADEQVVLFALDVLFKDGLLAPATPLPRTAQGVTRRDMLQKMGVGAMAIPVVTALFVSPAKAHASSVAPTEGPKELPTAASQGKGGGFWKWLEDLF
ncbi:MAG TPA: PqqD family protein [Acidobacteriaceae bacterium]